MKRLLVLVLAVVMLVSASITAAPQRIEAELNLITPVASFVSVLSWCILRFMEQATCMFLE
jgi:hypothetical protein